MEYTHLDGVYVGYDYSGIIENVVKKIKYGGFYALRDSLLNPISFDLHQWVNVLDIDLITWIPTARKRKWERGFNQSKLFADKVAKESRYSAEVLLLRTSYEHSQVGSSAEERWQNVKSSFKVVEDMVLPSSVLIIDDVMTTGATLEVCAQKLKGKGVKKVYAAVIARNRPINKENML